MKINGLEYKLTGGRFQDGEITVEGESTAGERVSFGLSSMEFGLVWRIVAGSAIWFLESNDRAKQTTLPQDERKPADPGTDMG